MARSHVARSDRNYVEYTSRLPQISRELAKQSSLANKDLADGIAQGARERVPVGRTGHLKAAIHVEFKGGGARYLDVGGDWDVVAGDHDAFYGHMVEFGTARAPAHPFLVPALEAMIPKIPRAYRRRYQSLSTGSAIK